MRASLPLLLLAGCLPGGFGGTDDGGDDGPDDLGATGTLEDYWQRTSAEYSAFDGSTAFPKTVKVTEPGPFPAGDNGGDIEVFLQLVDDALVTYALREGDQVIYRLSQSAISTDDESFGVQTLEGASRIFSMDEGHLVETSTLVVDEGFVMVQATYGAWKDDFPPAGWPTTILDAEVGVMP